MRERIFSRVLFPAPFRLMMPTTSRRAISKLTSRRAQIPLSFGLSPSSLGTDSHPNERVAPPSGNHLAKRCVTLSRRSWPIRYFLPRGFGPDYNVTPHIASDLPRDIGVTLPTQGCCAQLAQRAPIKPHRKGASKHESHTMSNHYRLRATSWIASPSSISSRNTRNSGISPKISFRRISTGSSPSAQMFPHSQ